MTGTAHSAPPADLADRAPRRAGATPIARPRRAHPCRPPAAGRARCRRPPGCATDSSAAERPVERDPDERRAGRETANTARSEIGIAAAKTRNGDGPTYASLAPRSPLDALRAGPGDRGRPTGRAGPRRCRIVPAPSAPPGSRRRSMPRPTIVASQPTTNSAGAARPSMVNVEVPARGRSTGRRRPSAAGASGGAAGSAPGRRRAVGSGGRSIPSGPGSGGRVGRAQRSGSGSCAGAGIEGPAVAARLAVRAGWPTADGSAAGTWRGRGGAARCGDPAGRLTAGGSASMAAAGTSRRSKSLPHQAHSDQSIPDQPAAVRADALQAGPAGRADDPFVVDPTLA